MEFPKTKGGMWAHEKTSEKQPDVKGHVEITRDVLRMLVNQAKAGVGDIKIQLAGWDRTAQSNGQRYISHWRGIRCKGKSRCCDGSGK